MRIFLSGAIEGVDDLAGGWRKRANDELDFRNSSYDYEIVSPLISFDQQVFREPNEIVHRNMLLQQSCDLLLVEYMIPNRCYVGTDFEMAMARVWHQPVVVFAHEMYRERVYLRYMATALLPSLDEALEYIQSYFPAELKGKK